MSVPEALSPERPGRGVRLVDPPPALRSSPGRARVLAAAGGGQAQTIAGLARRAGCGEGVVRGLIAAGADEDLNLIDGVSDEPPGAGDGEDNAGNR